MRLLPCLALLSLVACAAPSPEATSSDEYTEDARVRFTTGSWEPTWSGALRGGRHLQVDYDFDRLPQCRNQGRLVSWVVEVSWQFDDGPISTAALAGSPGSASVLPDTGIAIPEGKHQIALWFQNRAVGGYDDCSAWDSRYGANYVHTIDH